MFLGSSACVPEPGGIYIGISKFNFSLGLFVSISLCAIWYLSPTLNVTWSPWFTSIVYFSAVSVIGLTLL